MIRYPFSDLARAMHLTEPAAARELGLSGSTEQQYRRDGLSEKVADRLAVRAGLHPMNVWPAWLEDAARAERERVAAYERERYRRDARVREVRRASRRAYYAANADYERERERRRYHARRAS